MPKCVSTHNITHLYCDLVSSVFYDFKMFSFGYFYSNLTLVRLGVFVPGKKIPISELSLMVIMSLGVIFEGDCIHLNIW